MRTKIRTLLPRFFRKIEIREEDRVSLEPVFGIKPRIYLAALYGAAVLGIFFFIFFFPGIIKPGVLGVFSSEPSGAAVRVDGVTMGSTPCEVFIPRGDHTIRFVLPGFTGGEQELTAGGRVFGSAFFPQRIFVSGVLSAPDPKKALALAAEEYIRWSFMGEPTEMYQIPRSLSEGAYQVGPAAADPWVRKSLEEVLEPCLSYAVSKASVRDILRAKVLLDNNGLSPSPLTVLKSIQDVSRRIGNTPAAASWLAEMVPGPGEAVENSPWAASVENAPDPGRRDGTFRPWGAPPAGGPSGSLPAGDLTVAGLRFIPAAAGGDPRSSIYVARTVISRSSWEAFTAENPRWSEANRGSLISEGLVQEEYLVPVDHPHYPAPAAPGLSWYAAAVYCRWLTTKLPPGLSDWEVRLPSEAEWKNAALYFKAQNTVETLSFGKLWEWCADPYIPLEFFSVPEGSLPGDLQSADRSVRGGCWINPGSPEGVDPALRGSLPPETSSPFVGFRPIIARRGIGGPISLWQP
ncbi:MAG: SUMF1/EgtB/PvdO family nonheme iron enzyme [Spirochaetaceae bacterium]|jgi:hypothetical protein|nr:SUMF1/EgtB/PvdO family nonheme iron enzyme [Spirochaetaceae bacterium]